MQPSLAPAGKLPCGKTRYITCCVPTICERPCQTSIDILHFNIIVEPIPSFYTTPNDLNRSKCVFLPSLRLRLRSPLFLPRLPTCQPSLTALYVASKGQLKTRTDQWKVTCLVAAIPSSGCGVTDVTCQCTTGQASLTSSLESCIPSRCSAEDAASM